MSSIQPIRFNTVADLNEFLKKLADKKLIKLLQTSHNVKISTDLNVDKLARHLIVATNGETYFWDDIIRATQDDRYDDSITFMASNDVCYHPEELRAFVVPQPDYPNILGKVHRGDKNEAGVLPNYPLARMLATASNASINFDMTVPVTDDSAKRVIFPYISFKYWVEESVYAEEETIRYLEMRKVLDHEKLAIPNKALESLIRLNFAQQQAYCASLETQSNCPSSEVQREIQYLKHKATDLLNNLLLLQQQQITLKQKFVDKHQQPYDEALKKHPELNHLTNDELNKKAADAEKSLERVIKHRFLCFHHGKRYDYYKTLADSCKSIVTYRENTDMRSIVLEQIEKQIKASADLITDVRKMAHLPEQSEVIETNAPVAKRFR